MLAKMMSRRALVVGFKTAKLKEYPGEFCALFGVDHVCFETVNWAAGPARNGSSKE